MFPFIFLLFSTGPRKIAKDGEGRREQLKKIREIRGQTTEKKARYFLVIYK
jgi:hypothetical protein